MRKYFVWDPQRATRFVRISDPPRTDAGEEISLFDGKDLPSEVSFNFPVEKVKVVPDFLYSVGLHLLVSERAWQLISEFNTAGIRPHPFSLLSPDGQVIGRYVWLNAVGKVDLLDRERSSVEEMGYGLRINRFTVADRNHLGWDVLSEKNTGWRVFSGELVRRIKRERLTGANFDPIENSTMF